MNNSAEDYMMEAGIVLVTFNYRLGPLGFMAIPGTNIQAGWLWIVLGVTSVQTQGNMGMKDQLLAMRWVKQNIARFGGDPGRITISGLSAGAVSVHGHVLSPLGRGEGLFHRAIAHSGTMLMPIDSEGVFEDGRLFLEKMCNMNTTVEGIPENLTASCLFSLSADALITECLKPMALWAQPMDRKIELEKADPSNLGYRMWVVVDDYADTPFMPSHPVTVLHNQQQKMVPFMTGVTKDEGALIAPMLWKDMNETNNVVKDNWGHIGAKQLFPGFREYTFDDQLKAKMIAHFYVGEGGLVRANKQGLMDMFTDAYFAAPNTETVRLHAKVQCLYCRSKDCYNAARRRLLPSTTICSPIKGPFHLSTSMLLICQS
jgi:carboxylesterase type B